MTTSPDYTPKAELYWRPDPLIDAARSLAEWLPFHKACGREGVYFDHMERAAGGKYRCNAFSLKKVNPDLYRSILLAQGEGAGVLGSIADAYAKCGRSVPGADEMLGRGLAGVTVAQLEAQPPEDDLDALLGGDEPLDMEELLG